MKLSKSEFAKAKSEAVRFLDILDPDTDFFTFQTFDDDKSRRDHSLARIYHGPLTKHFDELRDLNQRGAGIFVTVNETDGQGRQLHNILHSRGVWIEADHGIPRQVPIEPTLIVQTSTAKHLHHYFLLKKGEILARENHSEVMTRLVQDYGHDKMATDFARVLRLPGFYHCKDPENPRSVHIRSISGRRYTTSELLATFPPVPKQRSRQRTHSFRPTDPVNEDQLSEALNQINSDDRDIWLKVGMALHNWSGGSAQGLALWNSWSAQSNKYDESEQLYTWSRFRPRSDGVTIATIFKLAKGGAR